MEEAFLVRQAVPVIAVPTYTAVDAHEEALDVELQDVRIAGVVERRAPDEPVNPLDTQVGSFADPAGVAVEDELALEEVVDLVDDEVMDYAVTVRRLFLRQLS